MLLRNRSRPMTKPPLMADHSSQPSPNQNYSKAIPFPSLFASPTFREFTTKCLSGTIEALRSPALIIDTRAISISRFGNPFSHETSETITSKLSSEYKSSREKLDSKGIGLALVDALKDDEEIKENSDKPRNAKVLFGTRLKLKIPPFPSSTFSANESQKNSSDNGIKTGNSLGPPTGSQNSGDSVSNLLSWSEMELSEEYTCVISHGPNPKTTHIFDNCIVESYCSLPGNSANFLSFCHTCKKHLEHTNDIFIYRGEKAFCSQECRYREMLLDEAENSKPDNFS